MAAAPDRRAVLLAQDQVTGIDFVHVHSSQTTLDVYFLRPPETLAVPLPGTLGDAAVHLLDTAVPARLPAAVAGWPVLGGRTVLRLTVPRPGGFAAHRLRLDDPRLDPWSNDVEFSFKAACESPFDCAPAQAPCPPGPEVDATVDYLARDFAGLRRALLDFAAVYHPDWTERSEADIGVMWAEIAAAVGDDLAYTQDRWAREAHWPTAVLRRSVRGHARLVDYELDDGAGSTTWVDVTVTSGSGTVTVPTGTPVTSTDGNAKFEIGRGLHDPRTGYPAADARNAFTPHVWDEDDTELPCGATALHLVGHHAAALAFDDPEDPVSAGPSGGGAVGGVPTGFGNGGGTPAPGLAEPEAVPGTWLLLRSERSADPGAPMAPVQVWPVRVVEARDMRDPVLGTDLTLIRWEKRHATPFPLDLTALTVRGNLLPATAGRTERVDFAVGADGAAPAELPRTVEREGPQGTVCHRFTLPGSDTTVLAWLDTTAGPSRPELLLDETGSDGVPLPHSAWRWRRSLLGVNSSLPTDPHITLEDGAWRRVAGYQVPGGELVHRDLADGRGATVRFGDGEFGAVPADGTRFRVTYRLCRGVRDDVPADTLVRLDAPGLPVDAVTNPVPAHGGRDPQSLDQARLDAPDAYRAVTYRAVRPEDYAEAVGRLPWVQRAGATLRWTGSWLTLFATADPLGSTRFTAAQRASLDRQLDLFRQAGRQTAARDPRYADLDLEVTVCVKPDAYPARVRADVLQALVGTAPPPAPQAFFHPDRFTFGTPLYRSRLEAAVQAVPGVAEVLGVRVRRRDRFAWREFTDLVLRVAPEEVVRVDQDPAHPDRGSLRVLTRGGV
ncbi:hypothetical protein ABZ016_19950 [Streptomyces sp. NPDC006372]|uniref:hypothetical protein n=1 Tax=Streptomyces sp. NPDC006372 TaxID=3155599 RepID=UPI0033BCD3C5